MTNQVTTAAQATANRVRRALLPMQMWAGPDIEAQARRLYPALRKESLGELCELLGARYVVRHMPAWRVPGVRPKNRPGRVRPGFIPRKDTGHGTANYNAGALALMHLSYLSAPNWGGPENTSYHHCVDHTMILEILPWWEEAYHGGTPTSNRDWLGTEMCEAAGSYGLRTIHNTAILFAAKRVKFGKPREWIVQHNAAYGKNCPGLMRRGQPVTWSQFLDLVDGYVAQLERRLNAMPNYPTSMVINGIVVEGSFLNYFNTHGGVQIFGLPIEERVDGQVGGWRGKVQWFERARFEEHDGVVMLGRVGVEAKSHIP